MELLELQIVFISSIFVGTLLFCLLPLLTLRKGTNVSPLSSGSQRALSYLNCVAGGVFIAMCFLGLIPMVQDKFQSVLKDVNIHTEFPVAECVVVLGLFFILTVEQLCLMCYRPKSHVITTTEIELKSSEDAESIRKLLDAEDFDGGEQDVLYELNTPHGKSTNNSGKSLRNGAGLSKLSPQRQHNNKPQQHGDFDHDNHCAHNHMAALIGHKMGLRFFVLVLALSIHALFEGLTLGLQKEKRKAIHLFVAILLHESLCAFALGVNTAKRRLTICASLKYVVFFCLTIPIGIGIGIALGQTPGLIGNVVSGTLQGLASGIFIHVTFMEILPAEFANGRDGLLKVLFVFIGFLIIAAVHIAQEVQPFLANFNNSSTP